MNSKQKGGGFERQICKRLSLWLTHGKRQDVFWRSAMSGGRATVHKGRSIRQSGDICAVAPEGHDLTDRWFIECKFVRDAQFGNFLIKGIGPLRTYWTKALKEAKRHGKDPMLIVKSNHYPIVVITRINHLRHFSPPMLEINTLDKTIDLTLFDYWMSTEYFK